MAPTKAELRREIRARRAARGSDPRESLTLLEVARRSGLLDPDPTAADGSGTIAAYVAAPGEPDPGPIRDAVRAAGGRVLLPLPGPDRQLAWAVDDGHHVPDPVLPVSVPAGAPIGEGASCLIEQGVTLLLVPALAVDTTGIRLGQGGGFYDRLLADLASEAHGPGTTGPGGQGRLPLVVAVVHPQEVRAPRALPREAHDAPVDAALTAEGLIMLAGE